MTLATGVVTKAFGNLLQVKFDGKIKQGEVGFVEVQGKSLKAEVIEILGNEAKIQVFEDTKGIAFKSNVRFSGELLEAELGPGLLSSIVDGLQNPLEEVAQKAGFFLPRGIYLNSLDRRKLWNFEPKVAVGDKVKRGDALGMTLEGKFPHFIMVPFACYSDVMITWVIEPGAYTIDTVIAKGRDSKGREFSFTMIQKWPIKNALLEGEKIKSTVPMPTGLRIIDTQFPLVKGGTFCTPGPFGAGKTVLQQHLSKFSAVDIVVICACGERAGEVVEVLREFPHLVDPHTGDSLMKRTVMICNTSSMPVAARESSIYLGATIAEYYRQMGLDVLLLADSTSRWAQALREMSGRLEEIPGDEAFPAYLASRIAEFYERSGTIALKDGNIGSLTIGGSVSPAGGNFEEPVTQATLAVVGAFLALSRERSDARRYPAIDPHISWSKYLDISKEEVFLAEHILQKGQEIGKRMEVIGEEGISLSDLETYLKAELYDFCYLQQNAFDSEDMYCALQKQENLFALIQQILKTHFHFKDRDQARSFFLQLQSDLKNMTYARQDSDEYRELAEKVIKELKA